MLAVLLLLSLAWGAQGQCPMVASYGNAEWPVTAPNTYAAGTCKPGYLGDPRRLCKADSTWSSNLGGTLCAKQYCPAITESLSTWATGNPGVPSVGKCVNGYGGRVTRMCYQNATWGPIDGVCAQCLGETHARATWPGVPASSYSYGTCELGWTGSPYRWCEPGGIWQSYVYDNCERTTCPAVNDFNASWNATFSGNFATGTCNNGFAGTTIRECQLDATWKDPVRLCVAQTTCPAESYARATWPATTSGSSSVGTCQLGWQGSPVRSCDVNGVWTSYVSQHCQRTSCAAVEEFNANWPSTYSGNFVSGTCKPGFVSDNRLVRQCKLDATFAPPLSVCYPISTCAQEEYARASWPATTSGQFAVGSCNAGYTGSPKRLCQPNGTWSGNVNEHCVVV